MSDPELIKELEKAKDEKRDWSDWDYANGWRNGIDRAIEIIKERP